MMTTTSTSAPRRRKGFFIFLLIVGGIFGISGIVMALWNAILPELLHVSFIGYWQSMGLLVLCRLLFGGFRGGGYRKRWGRSGWRDRYMNMSEEEKAALRSKWQERCRR